MTQLSSNTIFYDKIIKQIEDFLRKYLNNKISSDQEIAEEYAKIVTEVNKYPIFQISKFEPVINGEPPSSAKMNTFISSASDDISIISKQLEYQTAMIVSLYNMFIAEVEKEFNFIDRIKSKVKILNTYSLSPSDSLFYYGDSFDTIDNVDIPNSLVPPKIEKGSATLPVVGGFPWIPSSVFIQSGERFDGNRKAIFKWFFGK
jgi:hypothetical protein